MNTPYPRRCTCMGQQSRIERQQGVISWAALGWLLVLALLGQGLVYFTQQGARQAGDYWRETELRLRAESMVEENYGMLQDRSRELDSLPNKGKLYLGTNGVSDREVVGYALKDNGLVYIIATAFDRRTAFGNSTELHVMAKGILKKEGEKYVWLGWAP